MILLGVRIREGLTVRRGRILVAQRDADVLSNAPVDVAPKAEVERPSEPAADTSQAREKVPAPPAARSPSLPATGRAGATPDPIPPPLTRRRVLTGAILAVSALACRPASPSGKGSVSPPAISDHRNDPLTDSTPPHVGATGHLAARAVAHSEPRRAVAVAPASGMTALPVPTAIHIDAIGVNAPVISVGVDQKGRMFSPDRAEDVVWFKPGPRPGEAGNAVLAGHVDRRNQGPAVFARLKEMTPGQPIDVTLTGGQLRRFVVRTIDLIDPAGPFAASIFRSDGPPRLVLITCAGIFDPVSQDYQHRLIVTAERLA